MSDLTPLPVVPTLRQQAVRAVWLLYWVGMFVATHWPRMPDVPLSSGDKLAHLLAFAGLAFLWGMDRAVRGLRPLAGAGWTVLVLAAYGAVDEQSQKLVGRSCELSDWTADILGAVLGLLLAEAVCWLYRQLA